MEEISLTDSYKLDVNVAVCLGSLCYLNVPLLVDTNIEMAICNYKLDYYNQGNSSCI